MKSILLCALCASLAFCGAIKSNDAPKQAASVSQTLNEQKPNEPTVSFKFLTDNLTVKYGTNTILKAVFTNHETKSIYIADWASSPWYYWQDKGVVTVKY